MTAKIVNADSPEAVAQAAAVLMHGGLVAFPTDTVYGLGCDVWNPMAVERIYSVKDRSELKAVPVLLSGLSALGEVALPQSPAVMALAGRFWPGPLTLVLARQPELPAQVSSTDTVGVRVPNHRFALELLASAGPLAVTSANPSGAQAARTADQVAEALGDQIELIIDGGQTPGGVPSTVVDMTGESPNLLRAGPIELDQITRVLHQRNGASPN